MKSDNAEGGPLWEPVNPKALPDIWKHLANERLMFAMDMDDIAVKIGPERQLFLDNYLIGKAEHINREVHHPVRSDHNPLKIGEAVLWKAGVMMFEEPPRFRMWYLPEAHAHAWKNQPKSRWLTSYAVSEDGEHWTLPDLDIYEIPEWPRRNIAHPYGMMTGLFYEPWEEDPARRFKAVMYVQSWNVKDGKSTKEYLIPKGYYIHTSPDGIHWETDEDHMVIPLNDPPYKIPHTGIGDTSFFWWDDVRKKYMGDTKWVLPGVLRCRAIMESDDLVHWTRPHPTFFASEPNIQIYGHVGMTYQGMYIGFRWHAPTDFFWEEVHALEMALDCSRDGKLWTRVGGDQLFMERQDTDRETYDAPHAWDADQMAITSILEVDEEIWFYYFGGGSVGLARLRQDGFASLNAGNKTGTIVTRPLTFRGKRLVVNATVSDGGRISVGFQTRQGQPVETFSTETCTPLTGDNLNHPVEWTGGHDISSLAESFSRIEFKLTRAKLYSFQIVDG